MEELVILEQKRKKCFIFFLCGIAGLIIGVISFVISFVSNGSLALASLFLLIIPGIVFIAIGTMKFNSLEKEFKNKCMGKIVSDIIPGAKYFPKLGIPLHEIYSYKLLKKGDREYIEDLIQGEINGVKFRTCDLKLEERRVHHNSNGGTTVTYVPYFTGRFFEFDFNKTFKGDLILTENLMIKPLGMQKINLESEEFNKKFKTFAKDEFSAFYVLTPQFMMALLDLEKTNPGAISISINSNKMAIALNNNRDTFSLKMNQVITDYVFQSFKKDMSVVNQIVEELSLNNKIFKEEY